MIVIIGKDKEFTHMLAEQIVSELKVSCECVQSEKELTASLLENVELLLTDMPYTHASLPIIMLTKPLKVSDILAEITTCLAQNTDDNVAFGRLIFSARGKILHLQEGGASINLTDKEAQLFQAIAQAGTEGISKDSLLKNLWGFENDLNTHRLETHIYRLRAKCKELCGDEVISASDNGYRLKL